MGCIDSRPQVEAVASLVQFNALLAQHPCVVVMFVSKRSPECTEALPVYQEVAANTPEAFCMMVDVEDGEAIATAQKAGGETPAFKLFYRGNGVKTFAGSNAAKLKMEVAKLVAS
mmetsp:Transcript_35678/g.77948  ORF Transcript_35678/g.77948 Transcript_35678/m.77948 type:complete len:115 (-) Transcript_35678:155-499(-)